MISVEEHLARILASIPAPTITERALNSSAGRVLAADVASRFPVPHFDNSGMDGYAVHHADAKVGATLRVVADIPAGSADDPRIGAGEAARIMTGAAVPSDADAIVPLEHTTEGTRVRANAPETITITEEPRPHAHIRRAGEDAPAGSIAVPSGTVLGPWQLSSIASAGHERIPVFARPRVAVISTGSELVSPSATPRRGQIPESNSVLLAAAVTEAGAEVEWTTTVADDNEALAAALVAPAVDAIILTGGASVGAFDVVKAVLNGVGSIEFTSVAMQPGKPQGFGLTPSGIPVFCLPGNPVSVAVSFEMFVRPALRRLAGFLDIERPRRTVPAGVGWKARADRMQVMPAIIVDDTVRPATHGGSGSHLVMSLAQATALALVPADVSQVNAGDLVTVMEIR
ncbi:molybdopterin molybdenumtransferase MoeA [Gordonia spumicola]|uniref:Molybdopterin molybdenumtransferase n=1 Tax=Gordonia spumicola TaxID=589161 RepID=A0A7I9V3E3_9ACTN|nr:gephyrin-like molybdotransferase Glp [Gordonia spumicola]GED99934.1 molybdopterin molybdenumtransferase MoeA [Gordonia spumicola]GEE04068.1 molybdopterin molybdenumtransferase MoeA [Gordonia spumicola]GEE04075.1 molybdopterin molybdenumtransferase MoeA [Gordonia spumicola]